MTPPTSVADLGHPMVKSAFCTCLSTPEQYEGELTDGRIFYFRYRFGRAALGLGATLEQAIDASWDNEKDYGDAFEGTWTTPEKRNRAFAELMESVLGMTEGATA